MMTMQIELKKQAYASNLKSRALSILIYLIDRSNKDLTCFPAISTMAKQLHISISTVKRALHELVDGGFIKKNARHREGNRGQTSNLYTLMLQENTSTPKQPKAPTEPASAIVETAEDSTTQKQERNVGSTVTYLTFESLKAEQRKNEDAVNQSVELTAEDVPVVELECSQETTASPVSASISKIAEAPIPQIQVVTQRKNSTRSVFYAGKAWLPARPVLKEHGFSFPKLLKKRESPQAGQEDFPAAGFLFLHRWTGVGFNLQPP